MAVWIDSQARAKEKTTDRNIYSVKVYKQTVHLQIKYLSL